MLKRCDLHQVQKSVNDYLQLYKTSVLFKAFNFQIDLKSADPDGVSKQMDKLFDIKQEEILKVKCDIFTSKGCVDMESFEREQLSCHIAIRLYLCADFF